MSQENKKITKAAAIVGSATLLSRILGFLRDMVVAGFFGVNEIIDAFYIAFKIPNMLRELFAEGSMSAGFVPVFTEYLTKSSKEEAKKLSDTIFTFLTLTLFIVIFLGIIFAPYIVMLVAPGFKDNALQFALTVNLTRIMFPFLLFIGLAALAMGVLNSLRDFLAPAIAPIMFNLVIIVTVLFMLNYLAQPIVILAAAVTVGGAFQYFIQVPALIKKKFFFSFSFIPRHPGMRKVVTLIIPTIFGLAITQINITVDSILASYLAAGSITFLYLGTRLMQFPLGVFSTAISTAVFPSMATFAAKEDNEGLIDTVSFGTRLAFFITIPAMVGLVTLSVPITNILFQRGEFTAEDTIGAAAAVVFYCVGLWAYSGTRIFTKAFYSLKDTKTPVKVGVLAMVANVFFDIMLMGPLGHKGLALATSISGSVNFIFLMFLLRKRLKRIDGAKIARSTVKMCLCSAVMGVFCYYVAKDPIFLTNIDIMKRVGIVFMTMLSGAGIYFLLTYLLKCEEIHFVKKMIAEKFKQA
jgi:putative peptidoglycan lipid II flippase